MIKEYISELIKNYQLIYKNATEQDFLLILILMTSSIFFFIISKTKFGKSGLLFFFTLPGTIIHEMLHFIMGILLLAQPASFSLFPKKTESGWILGSVEFYNINFINAIPIAMAPILAPILLLLTFPALYNYIAIQKDSIFLMCIYGYVLISVLSECIPSSQDFKVMFSKPLGFIFYGGIIYLIIKNIDNLKDIF